MVSSEFIWWKYSVLYIQDLPVQTKCQSKQEWTFLSFLSYRYGRFVSEVSYYICHSKETIKELFNRLRAGRKVGRQSTLCTVFALWLWVTYEVYNTISKYSKIIGLIYASEIIHEASLGKQKNADLHCTCHGTQQDLSLLTAKLIMHTVSSRKYTPFEQTPSSLFNPQVLT